MFPMGVGNSTCEFNLLIYELYVVLEQFGKEPNQNAVFNNNSVFECREMPGLKAVWTKDKETNTFFWGITMSCLLC